MNFSIEMGSYAFGSRWTVMKWCVNIILFDCFLAVRGEDKSHAPDKSTSVRFGNLRTMWPLSKKLHSLTLMLVLSKPRRRDHLLHTKKQGLGSSSSSPTMKPRIRSMISSLSAMVLSLVMLKKEGDIEPLVGSILLPRPFPRTPIPMGGGETWDYFRLLSWSMHRNVPFHMASSFKASEISIQHKVVYLNRATFKSSKTNKAGWRE